jgi:phage/plasmid-like protein (TIGR03299 family)
MPAEFDTGAFVRTPAWHQLGVVLPEYPTVHEMYVESGLNWNVELMPLAAVLGNGQGVVFEDKFASVRTDKGIPLGVVGSRYEPIQNEEMFTFIEALLDDPDVKLETAGALRNGKVTWLQAKLDGDYSVDGDEFKSYLTVATSHDGTIPFAVYPTNIRVVCANTFSAAYSTKTISYAIKHTKNAKAMVDVARQALGLVFEDKEQFVKDVDRLMNLSMNEADVAAQLDKLIPPADPDKDSARTVTSRTNQRGSVMSIYNSPTVGTYRNTGWGWINAVNEYEQWGRTVRGGRPKYEAAAERFLLSSAKDLTAKALANLGIVKPS